MMTESMTAVGDSYKEASHCCAGDPVRLFHHLGAGVWSFLASPAAGLVEGARGRAPERFAAGVAAGLRGLLSNIVYGFASATAKMSRAARQVRSCSGPEVLTGCVAGGPSHHLRTWDLGRCVTGGSFTERTRSALAK